MRDRVLNRPLGDFVEHHPLHRLIVQQIALAQNFVQMPGNGLAFAIRVGGQIQRFGLGNALAMAST
jgi:hypothetical protein